MPYFKYKNKSCYYEEQGTGNPLIFLHGNTASSNMFRGVAASFAEEYKVILIDFLGHGKSERVEYLDTDLWYDEAMQVIAFLEQSPYKKADLIGSSGGALVAINVALERPDLVGKVIADSFEGEFPLKEFTQNVIAEREASKQDENARAFYFAMHGEDWESIVDKDSRAIDEHARAIGKFFHKDLRELHSEILLTGSREDEFLRLISPDYFATTYGEMIKKIGHGEMKIFETGGHPALLSNQEEFVSLARKFLME